MTEIEIHRSLKHKSIVAFIDCFEDNTNVYILLEMCSNQSLFDMVKRRRTLSISEVKFYTMQVLAGVNFMHNNLVIHRDLKLGNIFLDEHMNLKIGDFGLASKLRSPSDRRKTICGTPNYIAPEILLHKESGHSFEVDIWSIGVIIYAMAYGKPPFQRKDVPEIYDRIKNLHYSFPEVSNSACNELIEGILQLDPVARLTVEEITTHAFFRRREPFPDQIPDTAMSVKPDFSHISAEASDANYRKAKSFVLSSRSDSHKLTSAVSNVIKKAAVSSHIRVKQDQIDSKDHILPASISPASTKEKYRMVMVPKNGVSGMKDKLSGGEPDKAEPAEVQFGEKSPVVQGPRGAIVSKNLEYAEKLKTTSSSSVPSDSRHVYPNLPEMSPSKLQASCNRLLEFTTAINNQRRMSYTSSPDTISEPSTDCPVFVAKWVDFSQKGGLTYQLTNDQVGILSFSGLTLTFDPHSNNHYAHRGYDSDPTSFDTQLLTTDMKRHDYGREVKLLKGYYNYMSKNLCKSEHSTLFDPKNHIIVRRHVRQDSYVIFELTDGSFQFNFPDHIKLIISKDAKYLSVIDSSRQLHTFKMMQVFRLCRSDAEITEQSRMFRKLQLSHKLDYCEQKLKRLWMKDSA